MTYLSLSLQRTAKSIWQVVRQKTRRKKNTQMKAEIGENCKSKLTRCEMNWEEVESKGGKVGHPVTQASKLQAQASEVLEKLE